MPVTPVTKFFDLQENAASLVEHIAKKPTADDLIEQGRKQMLGGGLMKTLAQNPNSQDGDRRLKETMQFFMAALENDSIQMERMSRGYSKRAMELVNQGLMSQAEYKVLAPWNETTNSAGGYSVPPEFAADLARNLGKYGWARRYFRHWPMKSNKTNVPGLLTKPSVAIYAENAAIAASKPAEDQTVLTSAKIAAIFASTIEALEDSNIEIYAVMQEIFSEQFGITEDTNAFQNANTTWNGLLWYGAGTITSGVAANGARAYSRKNLSTGGETTYPQFGDALTAAGTDNWGDMLLLQTGQPSALFQDGKYFVDQNVLIALLSARSTQGLFGVDVNSLLRFESGMEGQSKLYFCNYEVVPIPSGIMLTYDASAHVSTPFTVFCNPIKSWTMMGQRGGFVVDTLREGTLDSVSLAANDLQAIRMKERVAFATARPETIAILRTDAS